MKAVAEKATGAKPLASGTAKGRPSPTAGRDLRNPFSTRAVFRLRLRRNYQRLKWSVGRLIAQGKRISDVLVALLLIVVLLPIIVIALFLIQTGHARVERVTRVGRFGERFEERVLRLRAEKWDRLVAAVKLNRLPVLMNILKGEMSFVGPRAASPDEMSLRQKSARPRFDVRPGLICLWWIRKRANIDYGSEVESDGEYAGGNSLLGDLGITLRAVPAMFYGDRPRAAPSRTTIVGVKIDNLTMSASVEALVAHASSRDTQPAQVCFVNADCANLAYQDPTYLAVLNGAWMTLADGIGMKLAGKLLSRGIQQNVNGTDLFPRLCEATAGTGVGMFLLGSRPGIAEAVQDWVGVHYPRATVSGLHDGYFSPEQEDDVIKSICQSGASILLVALGAPRQDLWISRRLGETGVKVAMGVGGLFDFYSGRISRAPIWMREVGIEWLYRFYQEPGRMWKRYFVGNALFLMRVARERFLGPRQAPSETG